MSKVAVVYWSGTGNTEMMAQKVAEGAKEAGAEVSVLTCADFSADDVDAYDEMCIRDRYYPEKNKTVRWRSGSVCYGASGLPLADGKQRSSQHVGCLLYTSRCV